MRPASVGHAFFAAIMIALGIVGLVHGNFAPVWDPLPMGVPGREVLVYLCAFVSLATGIGLFWQRTAALAARVLFASLLLWLLLFRLPDIFFEPIFGALWSACSTGAMFAAAWVLYTWFADEWDRHLFPFVAGHMGLRIARILFGLILIFFGSAHFIDLKDTVSLVPAWLQWHVVWAYFTGSAFIAAGVAVLIGVFARLATALVTFQIGMFSLLVWVPIVAAGSKSAFQWSETILSFALTAGAWVMADSYRVVPGFAARKG